MDLFYIMIRYVKRLGALEDLWLLEVLCLGALEIFSTVAAVHPVFECTKCSVEEAVDYAYHHSSPLLCFYKWGSLVLIHTSLSALGSWWHRGLLLHGAVTPFLLWGVEVGAGGLASPFLIQTNFLTLTLLWGMECLL